MSPVMGWCCVNSCLRCLRMSKRWWKHCRWCVNACRSHGRRPARSHESLLQHCHHQVTHARSNSRFLQVREKLGKVSEFEWSGKGQEKYCLEKWGKSHGEWKICATTCQIFRLKCIKFDFRWGSAPDPTWGAYSAPPDSLAALNTAP